MKALVGAFNQEKALVGAFSVIVQPVVDPMDRFTALLEVHQQEQVPVQEEEEVKLQGVQKKVPIQKCQKILLHG